MDLFRPQTPPELFLSTNMMFLEDIEIKKKKSATFFSGDFGASVWYTRFCCLENTWRDRFVEKPPVTEQPLKNRRRVRKKNLKISQKCSYELFRWQGDFFFFFGKRDSMTPFWPSENLALGLD